MSDPTVLEDCHFYCDVHGHVLDNEPHLDCFTGDDDASGERFVVRDEDFITPKDARPVSGVEATRLNREMREFINRATETMAERLGHGAAKFGATSWRDGTYTDGLNLARLNRAVAHLVAARAQSNDPAEWRKRAADVANQAFMYADEARAALSPTPEAE